ncbi:unnamed protein product [Hymenolepis diminuta]|uniref:Uncharacterized protein n=1 Tax=Hymenolepis diminuta TaxID=6216 RepID=A0A564Y6V8_HYMDI|nr:unnamed protein product [Hymenolepis diminuta]
MTLKGIEALSRRGVTFVFLRTSSGMKRSMEGMLGGNEPALDRQRSQWIVNGETSSYVSQQDSTPSHQVLEAQDWMDRGEFSSSYHSKRMAAILTTHRTLIRWSITCGAGRGGVGWNGPKCG